MRIIILSLVFLTSSIQLANAEPENISEGKILEIRVTENIVQVVQENATYPEGCDNVKFFRVPTSGKRQSLFLSILAAYQSGLNVRLKTSKCIVSGGFNVDITEVLLK